MRNEGREEGLALVPSLGSLSLEVHFWIRILRPSRDWMNSREWMNYEASRSRGERSGCSLEFSCWIFGDHQFHFLTDFFFVFVQKSRLGDIVTNA